MIEVSAQPRQRMRIREIVGRVLIAAVVIGLVVLVYWIVTERPCPRYPGIEKLRGGAGSLCPDLAELGGVALYETMAFVDPWLCEAARCGSADSLSL